MMFHQRKNDFEEAGKAAMFLVLLYVCVYRCAHAFLCVFVRVDESICGGGGGARKESLMMSLRKRRVTCDSFWGIASRKHLWQNNSFERRRPSNIFAD